MKKTLVSLIVLAAVGGSAFAYYTYKADGQTASVSTTPVTRGDIADSVSATGTLQAVTTVQVGTQVSGTIQELYADFNSLVKKGQVLVRLDPSLFQTQIEQAQANLSRSQADLERLKVTLDDARTKLVRTNELWAQQLIPRTELDTAEVSVRSMEAQIRSSQAQVTQAQASLNQSEVNLAHTVIEAPIDGLVISRNVDVGQTVAASMQAPTLFVLAADLTKMQVVASLDESDVGRIRPDQPVRFRVDAYPAEEFVGTVSQVRLQPQTVQNVVTYATVIDVPNTELKLRPGMTAIVTIEIARRSNVIRIPSAALRFRPTNEIFAALGQLPPEPGAGNRGTEGARRTAPQEGPSPQPGRMDTSGDPADRRGGANRDARTGGGGPGTGRGDPARMMERLESLPPEERERVLDRMRARGVGPGDATATEEGSSPRRPRETAASGAERPEATTIDALFGPLPRVESIGRVWLYVDNELRPVRVRLGITDGQTTELLDGPLNVESDLVTNVTTGGDARPTPTGGANFPLFGQPGGRFRGR